MRISQCLYFRCKDTKRATGSAFTVPSCEVIVIAASGFCTLLECELINFTMKRYSQASNFLRRMSLRTSMPFAQMGPYARFY